jgi:hypothetical protein
VIAIGLQLGAVPSSEEFKLSKFNFVEVRISTASVLTSLVSGTIRGTREMITAIHKALMERQRGSIEGSKDV